MFAPLAGTWETRRQAAPMLPLPRCGCPSPTTMLWNVRRSKVSKWAGPVACDSELDVGRTVSGPRSAAAVCPSSKAAFRYDNSDTTETRAWRFELDREKNARCRVAGFGVKAA